ncbi:MAG: hypothetical protein P0Y51_28490 [Candidatus Pseudomonas colombiensis]|nr:MAG: hypothetical protein P0Y51_28490 [Pseudomonas sp.]
MFDLNLLTGNIRFDDLSHLTDQPLTRQLDALKEDLLQVEYPGQLLLDVGWYPEFDKDGAFRVQVIKDQDWQQPLSSQQARSLAALRERLVQAQDLLSTLRP